MMNAIDYNLVYYICKFLPWISCMNVDKVMRNYVLQNISWKKYETMVVVVGMRYKQPEHRFMRIDKLLLRLDLNNSFDSNAIAVFVNNRHVGYLTRKDSMRIKPYICSFSQMTTKLVRNYTASAKFKCSICYPDYLQYIG